MRDMFQKFNNYLVNNIDILEKSVRKAREDEIQEVNFYGVSLEVANIEQYKDRKQRHEDNLFINCFARNDSNGKNGDLGAYYLKDQVIKALDEMADSLTDSNLHFYMIKFESAKDEPEYNSDYNLWQLPIRFKVRWKKL